MAGDLMREISYLHFKFATFNSVRATTIPFCRRWTTLWLVLVQSWWTVRQSSIKLCRIDVVNIRNESTRCRYFDAKYSWLRNKIGKCLRPISNRKRNSRSITGILRMILVLSIEVLLHTYAAVIPISAKYWQHP